MTGVFAATGVDRARHFHYTIDPKYVQQKTLIKERVAYLQNRTQFLYMY